MTPIYTDNLINVASLSGDIGAYQCASVVKLAII